VDGNWFPILLTAFLSTVTAIATVIITGRIQRRGQNLGNEVAVVDNYQEDISDLRKENAELRVRMERLEKNQDFMRHEANRVVDEARDLYYSVDEEVVQLRRGVDTNTVPPLPPRPTRKPFPSLNFTQINPNTS
jgi:hypothetical protein